MNLLITVDRSLTCLDKLSSLACHWAAAAFWASTCRLRAPISEVDAMIVATFCRKRLSRDFRDSFCSFFLAFRCAASTALSVASPAAALLLASVVFCFLLSFGVMVGG